MSDDADTPTGTARGTAVSAASGRLRGFAVYGVARVLVEALLGLRGLVLASILGPEIFGVWAMFRVIMDHCGSVGMSLLRGLEREASAPLAGALNARADSAATALGFMLLAFGGLSMVAALVAGLDPGHWLAPALAGVACGLVLDGLWSYGTTYLRATAELWRLARCELISAVLQIALVVALAWVWGLEGALLGFVLATAAVILLLPGRVPMRPALSLSRLRSLLHTGFPVGLTLVLMTSLASIDRIVVAAFAGAEALGYYAFAVSVSSLGAVVAFVLRTQVFPEVYRDAQARGVLPATEAHLRVTIAPFTWMLSPILGALALMLDPVVRFFAPEYESAIPAARIFLFTGVVAGLANLATLGVVAANRQWRLPGIAAGAFALNLLLAVAALAAGLGLEGLAAAMLVGRTAYAAWIVVVAARGSGLTGWPALLARMLLPLVWCAVVAAVLGHLLPVAGGMTAVTAVVVYLLALLPLVPCGRVALREPRRSTTSGVGSR